MQRYYNYCSNLCTGPEVEDLGHEMEDLQDEAHPQGASTSQPQAHPTGKHVNKSTKNKHARNRSVSIPTDDHGARYLSPEAMEALLRIESKLLANVPSTSNEEMSGTHANQ